MPAEFWNLTFCEYDLICKGYYKRIERKWEQTRFIGALLININRKKGKKAIKPSELIPLSFDDDRKKYKTEQLKSFSKEEIDKLAKKWRLNG